MDNIELEKRLKFYEDKYGPYVEKRGMHNWKNLFRRPTMNEWIILALLFTCIAFAIASNQNAVVCQQAIDYWNQAHSIGIPNKINISNLTNFTMVGDINVSAG